MKAPSILMRAVPRLPRSHRWPDALFRRFATCFDAPLWRFAPLGVRWLPLRGLLLALGGDVGGAGKRARVIGAEQLGAELHRRVELRLAEAAFRRRRGAQPIEQLLRPGVEIVLQIGMNAP